MFYGRVFISTAYLFSAFISSELMRRPRPSVTTSYSSEPCTPTTFASKWSVCPVVRIWHLAHVGLASSWLHIAQLKQDLWRTFQQRKCAKIFLYANETKDGDMKKVWCWGRSNFRAARHMAGAFTAFSSSTSVSQHECIRESTWWIPPALPTCTNTT